MDIMTRRLAPSSFVKVIEIDDSLVLTDQRSGQYFGLNETGARVWRLLEQGVMPEAILQTIGAEFDASDDVIAEDTKRLLTQLHGASLLT